MTHEQKMEKAIQRAYDRGLIKKEFIEQLPSAKELAIGIVVVGGILALLGVGAALLAGTGVGLALEAIAAAIVAGLAAAGVIKSGKEIWDGIVMLYEFYGATKKATSYPELDAAGKDFAEGLARVGVGVMWGILSYFGARQGFKMGKGVIGKWKRKPIRLEGPSTAPPDMPGIGPAYRTFEEADAAADAAYQARLASSPNAKEPHVLGVVVKNPRGDVTHSWYEVSEEGVGTGEAPLRGHTEQKALLRTPATNLEPESEIVLIGEHPPCSLSGGCSAAMRMFADRHNVTIRYRRVLAEDYTDYWFYQGAQVTNKMRKNQ